MYKIKKNSRTLEDGTKITTYSREIESCNILEVEAGTTGYCGGDTGHGGRTYFRIQNAASTDMEVHSYTDRYNDYVFGVECQPFIFAVSKQTPCDHDAFSFNSEQDQEYLKEALEDVKEHQNHIADLIAGRAEPERCGHCEYCRATKQITAFTSAADIEVE